MVKKDKQSLIFIVGPDMCGKTEIAKELSERIGSPYFKASSEHTSFLSSRIEKNDQFLNQLRFADPRAFDLLKQTGHSVVFDRGFPCEYAYSTVLKRETDMTMIKHMDEQWASLNALIVMCYRSSYVGLKDDLDPTINETMLSELHDAYVSFLSFSKCKHYMLNVDDENLNREVREIIGYTKAIECFE